MKRVNIRFYFRVDDAFTWVHVFAGEDGAHLGKCGDLTMRNEEFESFRLVMENAPPIANGPIIEFVSILDSAVSA